MDNIKEKECDGVYIIDSGSCQVVNSYDGHEITTITRGDYFGESQALKIPVSFLNIDHLFRALITMVI
jgi:CRP-like cAMP-binding protein